jgi:hypothetical protein
MIDPSEVARTYGIELVKLEDYIQQTFKVVS